MSQPDAVEQGYHEILSDLEELLLLLLPGPVNPVEVIFEAIEALIADLETTREPSDPGATRTRAQMAANRSPAEIDRRNANARDLPNARTELAKAISDALQIAKALAATGSRDQLWRVAYPSRTELLERRHQREHVRRTASIEKPSGVTARPRDAGPRHARRRSFLRSL